jgi:hypothetical protein
VVFRFLVFLLLAYFFFRVLRVLIRTKRDQDARSNIGGKEAQEMVLDPQCQSYLPRGESIFRGGHYFCSEQCARLYLAR